MLPLLIMLCLVEVVCRLNPHVVSPTTGGGYVVLDRDLIWRLKPIARGPGVTNELGLHDTPFNARADVKVLLLGDSVSYGDSVFMRQAFPYLLEGMLNESGAPATYEVINTGVLGYSTFQEAAYLRIHGLRLKPDLVVLQFCLNDVVERYHTLAAFGGDNVFLGIDTRQRISGAYGFLMRQSRAFEWFMRFLQRRGRAREEYDVQKMARNVLSEELEEAWQRTLGEIDEILQMTAEHHIPFLLVIAPYRFQLHDPHGTRQPQNRLIEYARSRQVRVFDLLPAFVEASGSDRPLFVDPSHFSVYGHRAAARLLVRPVREALDSVGVPDEK